MRFSRIWLHGKEQKCTDAYTFGLSSEAVAQSGSLIVSAHTCYHRYAAYFAFFLVSEGERVSSNEVKSRINFKCR
jgi:hypothetical protein